MIPEIRINGNIIQIPRIGEFIGPGGKNIKSISAEFECEVNVEDTGLCIVMGGDQDKIDQVVKILDSYNLVPTVGDIYDAEVVRIMDFGAFVKIAPGKEGLVHISSLSWEHVKKVEDVVKEGDRIKARIIKLIPEEQKIGLSLKDLDKEIESEKENNNQEKETISKEPDAEQENKLEKKEIQDESLSNEEQEASELINDKPET